MVFKVPLLVCSDSQVQSLFIQLDLLSESDPQFGMCGLKAEVLNAARIPALYLSPIACDVGEKRQKQSHQHFVALHGGLPVFTVCQSCVELMPGV